ncbi:uncharacterized protein V6R79_016628 [Siganus canaliculatus]
MGAAAALCFFFFYFHPGGFPHHQLVNIRVKSSSGLIPDSTLSAYDAFAASPRYEPVSGGGFTWSDADWARSHGSTTDGPLKGPATSAPPTGGGAGSKRGRN